jgi:F0F1-type ATP synthase assembly protein I
MAPASGGSPSGGDLVGLAVLLAAAVVIPLVIGVALDAALRTGPLFFLVGLLVGIAAAVAVVYVGFVRRYS